MLINSFKNLVLTVHFPLRFFIFQFGEKIVKMQLEHADLIVYFRLLFFYGEISSFIGKAVAFVPFIN